MKKPRFDYYVTSEEQEKPIKPLHSPLDNMPVIDPPPVLQPSPQSSQQHSLQKNDAHDSVMKQEETQLQNGDDLILEDSIHGGATHNTTRNITSNTTSSITLLPYLDTSDIDDLREPATQVQSFRLTDANKKWLQEVTYRINKEIKRGKITQADVLRIAIKMFEKWYMLNKEEMKKLLDKIK